MTRGRKGNKSYTGYNGAAEDKLREMDKLAHTPAGQFGRVAPLSPEAVMRFIETQTCPWCGEGPYKILVAHTRRAHGVTGAELREMAGLIKTASVCDPSLAAAKAERLKGTPLPDSAYAAPRRPRVLSEAAKQVARDKLAATRSPEAQRLRAAAGQPTSQVAAARASVARTAELNAGKYAEIERLAADGEITVAEIAARVGLHKRTVGIHLRRVGRAAIARKAHRQKKPEQVAEFRARMSAGTAERQERLKHDRSARYESLGRNWQAVVTCASEWGVTVKSAAGYLRSVGFEVPDGRSGGAQEPSRRGGDS